MESCPTQAVLPLVGLAAEKVIRDRYNWISVPRPGTGRGMVIFGGRFSSQTRTDEGRVGGE
ncbi:MAG: hypothetical protein R6U98_34590 [Pirellulaceae bacterium]